MNARLREIAEERESILHQLGTLRRADERQAGQAARMNSLREFVERRETKFAVYDDAITRKFVEQITVLDAETIRIKFRYPGLEVDKGMPSRSFRARRNRMSDVTLLRDWSMELIIELRGTGTDELLDIED